MEVRFESVGGTWIQIWVIIDSWEIPFISFSRFLSTMLLDAMQ